MEEEKKQEETCCCHEEKSCNESGDCTCGGNCSCEGNESKEGTCKCCAQEEDSSNEGASKEKKKKTKKDKHLDKLNEAYNKISELEDKLLREKAESANYRKRKEEEVVKLLKYSSEDIVKEILPIADNFERALSMSDDEDNEFFKGFKMIYCNLISALEKYEVKAIDGVNKPFNPTYHEAVLTEQKEGIEEGIVLEVMQKGYLLKDKVIRPAMVKVSI